MKDGNWRDDGDGLVEKVKDWTLWMKWANLIVASDNAKYVTMLEPYRKYGYPIFGCPAAAVPWELDRSVGQKIFKDAGIEIMDSKEFKSYDDAINFVKKTMKRYVSKPNGDVDKALSYVSKSPRDMIAQLERWKKLGKLKQPFILQEFTPGVEMAVGGWFGKNGWNEAISENWEHKKFMNDNLSINTGEMGCYDSNTEVLTESGWKFWPDVTMEDKLATLVDGKTVFENPSKVVSYDYDGNMVCWNNQTLDIMVSPNHNMYVNKQSSERKKDDSKYEFILAEDCLDFQYEIKRTADWDVKSDDYYVIKERKSHTKTTKEKIFPMIPWAKFMGIAVAEGWFGEKSIIIAQSHQEKFRKVEDIIIQSGLKYIKQKNGFAINCTQIAQHFIGFGKSWEKKIPDFIKNGSKEVIEAFLEGYALGDRNTQPNGFRIFYTTSKYLADGVQELLLKIGKVGIIKERNRIGKSNIALNGKQITSRRISYEVIERIKKNRSWLDKRDRTLKHYSGKIYCATVSSHILYVRRNGKPLWCGNTVCRYVSKSKLFDMVLAPLSSQLMKIGYVGYVDVAVIIRDTDGVPLPLEFTTRFGCPHFAITSCLNLGDPAIWMADLLEGYDSLEFKEGQIATGIVMSLPDFPYNSKPRSDISNIPVYCDQNKYIYPFELKAGIAPDEINGKIVNVPTWVTSGTSPLVACGVGMTVSGSIKKAYENIKKIEIPNSPGYRTDIGLRLKKELPILQKNGYCLDLVY